MHGNKQEHTSQNERQDDAKSGGVETVVRPRRLDKRFTASLARFDKIHGNADIIALQKQSGALPCQ
jgi:hypothetical protein